MRNNHCCCPDCYTRGSCHDAPVGFQEPLDPSDLTIVWGRCCKCFPQRICVTLTLPEGCDCDGDDPTDPYDRTLGLQLAFDCDSFSYSGSFQCGQTSLSFSIRMIEDQDDGHVCWLGFESACLGYTGANVLRIPLGGEYQDHEAKKAECQAFEFAFEIDLGECFYGCGTATISITPDDMIAVPRCENTTCPPARACLTLTDDYAEETLLLCVSEADEYGNYTYTGLFNDPYSGNQIEIIVHVDADGANATLTIEALSLGDLISEASVDTTCPSMEATWEFYEGWTVTIKGDQRSWCTDCKCICRCICVTKFVDSGLATPGKVFTGTACWDDAYACADGTLGGWEVNLVDAEGLDPPETVAFHLVCDECTGITWMVFDGDPDNRKEIVCPDIKSAVPGSASIEWTVMPFGEEPYTIRVTCLGCRPCRLRTPESACCPERLGTNQLPAVLHAEVISTNADCECMMGATASLVWDGSEVDPKWEGFWELAQGEPPCPPGAEGSYVAVGCCGSFEPPTDPCRNWCMDMCGEGLGVPAEPGCSCDPLELTFVGGGGCGVCEEPATSAFTALVTE